MEFEAVTPPEGLSSCPDLIILDVGDVLVKTNPVGHLEALGTLAEIPTETVREILAASGVVDSLERGAIQSSTFVAYLRAALQMDPRITDKQIRGAWNKVVVGVDRRLADLSRRLAASRRLILASNTNALHWECVAALLAAAHIASPVCLSFRLGVVKPESGYFTALAAMDGRIPGSALLVDDSELNVAGAARYGLPSLLYRPDDARQLALTVGL